MISRLKLPCFLLVTMFSSLAWAAGNELDPKVTVAQADSAGIGNLDETVRAALKLKEKTDLIYIKHVITTGSEQADVKNSIILDIPILEKINPVFDANALLKDGRQIVLNDRQVESIIRLLDLGNNTPDWLTDKNQKKFIQTVWATYNISPLSVKDVQAWADWLIKSNQLLDWDHPSIK